MDQATRMDRATKDNKQFVKDNQTKRNTITKKNHYVYYKRLHLQKWKFYGDEESKNGGSKESQEMIICIEFFAR